MKKFLFLFERRRTEEFSSKEEFVKNRERMEELYGWAIGYFPPQPEGKNPNGVHDSYTVYFPQTEELKFYSSLVELLCDPHRNRGVIYNNKDFRPL